MRVHFTSHTLAEVLRDIYLRERSGVLVLRQDTDEKRVHFDRGMILFAESALEEESLGACLVREGGISAGALSEAQRSLNGTPDIRALAAVLVNRDLLAKETLTHTVRLIIDRVVQAAFQWDSGSAQFADGEQAPGILETDILATIEILLNGIFRMKGFESIHEAMRALDNRLRVRKPTPLPIERLALSPAHGFILSRVDGNTNLKDLLSILPPGDEETASRFLFGLLLVGVVEYEPTLSNGPFKVADILRDHADRQALERMQEQMIKQVYAHIREQNPYEILGQPSSATPPQIERAYEETKAQFGRDRVLPQVRERFRAELAVIESRLIEAFLTLTQPDRGENRNEAASRPRVEIEVDDLRVRVEMDKAKSKVALEQANKVADAYYAKARRCMREGDFHNAIQYGKLAISYNGSDARYYSMLADCQVRNPEPRWQRMAEENYTKATQLDPWNADYWVSLGRFYKNRGLHIRAKKQFEEALKLVPSNEVLLKEMEGLG